MEFFLELNSINLVLKLETKSVLYIFFIYLKTPFFKSLFGIPHQRV